MGLGSHRKGGIRIAFKSNPLAHFLLTIKIIGD